MLRVIVVVTTMTLLVFGCTTNQKQMDIGWRTIVDVPTKIESGTAVRVNLDEERMRAASIKVVVIPSEDEGKIATQNKTLVFVQRVYHDGKWSYRLKTTDELRSGD